MLLTLRGVRNCVCGWSYYDLCKDSCRLNFAIVFLRGFCQTFVLEGCINHKNEIGSHQDMTIGLIGN